MTAERSRTPPPRRILGIGTAVVVMVALVLLLGRFFTGDEEGPDHPPPLRISDGTPLIDAEADVFRPRPSELGIAPTAPRDSAAHARTLAMFERLRAYPGAPPRIPHGLTAEEFRSGTCNICHRRGGYAARFGNYAPVTPHPDRPACLQCHVPRDTLVGTPLPTMDAPNTCAQCHVNPDARPPTFVASEWRTTTWPERDRRALPEGPLWIPHGLEGRGSCLACHAGPGSVEEIRTDHPERTNCRQCHVHVSSEDESTLLQPPDSSVPPPGEAS